jgi:phospholipid transport system substrate-binding protein
MIMNKHSTQHNTLGGAMKHIFTAVTLVITGSFIPVSVFAEDTAEKTIERVVTQIKSTVNDNEGMPPAELDEKLMQVIKPAFDFREIARRSLGANWRRAKESEQEEFTELFSQLLAKNYLKQIRDNAKDSEFQITSSSGEGIRSLIQTQVKTPKENVKIDYRLYQRKGSGWKVYDVVIENIGLVSNYRSEFAGIVNREGMPGLIAQLKTKLEE